MATPLQAVMEEITRSLLDSSAGEINRHPEFEVLLVTQDSRTEVTKKALNWLQVL